MGSKRVLPFRAALWDAHTPQHFSIWPGFLRTGRLTQLLWQALSASFHFFPNRVVCTYCSMFPARARKGFFASCETGFDFK
jgi:hypothetical protein